MTQTQRILASSILSVLLVVVGLFVVCSGRVQDVAFEDEFLEDELLADTETDTMVDEEYKDNLLSRLEVLEENGETSGAEESVQPEVEEAESFLTPELFNSMRAEVTELNTISSSKSRMIDSLRNELQVTNSRRAALATTPGGKTVITGSGDASVYNTEYGMYYQDALDDFYVRNYDRAIRKFRELLTRGDRNELTDNCQYWIGEAYFALGNYYQAIAEFQKVLPLEDSNKINDAQLMIGISFLKAGEPELARSELNTVITFAGNSESAKKAMRYLKLLDKA